MVERRKQGLWYRLVNFYGPQWNKPIYIALQFCYTIVVMLPCYVMYYRYTTFMESSIVWSIVIAIAWKLTFLPFLYSWQLLAGMELSTTLIFSVNVITYSSRSWISKNYLYGTKYIIELYTLRLCIEYLVIFTMYFSFIIVFVKMNIRVWPSIYL